MDKPKKINLFKAELSFGGANLTQRALLAKHLSVMLSSGLTITEALAIAEESFSGRIKRVIKKVSKSVRSGRPLSEAFRQYPKVFSNLFISAVYAGETSGTLAENLERIADQLEKEKELATKIKGAMLYPIIVLGASFMLGTLLTFFVLPKITTLFEGLRIDLPFSTRVLIAFSHFVESYGALLFFGSILSFAFIVWVVRMEFSNLVTHWLLLRIPIVKTITRNAQIARFCRTLGTLLKSGIGIEESMEIAKTVTGNYYYKHSVIKMSRHIIQGSRLSENIAEYKKLFPVMVPKMIRVGEESGRMEDTLFYLASFYEAEVDAATKSISTTVEPLLLLIIGIVVGFLTLSIITPIYQITGTIAG